MDVTLIAIWSVSAVLTASVMAQKRRNALVGLLVGALLGPLALLLALASGRGHSKRCPYCRETIDRDAIRCPRCQSVLDEKMPDLRSAQPAEEAASVDVNVAQREQQSSRGATIRTLTAVLALALGVIVVYVLFTVRNVSVESTTTLGRAQQAEAQSSPRVAAPTLRLLSADCKSSDTTILVRCTGAVQNTGSVPVDGVRVVVTWYSDGGVPQSSDSGFLDYDPLPPGQTSTWKVLGRLRDQTKWSVGFSTARGERIGHVDDRAANPAATPK